MIYYPDTARIEDALIPSLLRYFLFMHIYYDPSLESEFQSKIKILEEEIDRAFAGLSSEKRQKIDKRLVRICRKIEDYVKKEKFDARKCLLTFTAWAQSLENNGGILPGESFKSLLNALHEIILQGYEEIENFQKIDLSAINHVEAIHKLVQNEGYF